MSSSANPGGPPATNVYLRRRLLVLAGLVAVIVAIVLIVVRPGASAEVQPSSVPTTTTPAADAEAEGTAECSGTQVAVTPITDATTYAPDAKPMLSLSVTNTGTTACSINAGTRAMVFTITSGTEIYWVSTDCQQDATDNIILLEPGKPITSTPFAWDRTRSGPDTCGTDREVVPAAGVSYHLTASLAGIESADTRQFILS
ncbi:hypothetical protein GCM10022198_26040 [Klugiella xanthotipulae]|nr:hypothetical protein [Klugiella xanthotipulae]